MSDADVVAIVARHLIGPADIQCIARGGRWQDMYMRTTVGGLHSADVSYSSDGKGVHVTRPTQLLIQWPDLADIIRAGLTGDTAETISVAYRAYTDVATESGSGWAKWQTDPVQAAELEAHQVRYQTSTARLHAVTREVVERGIAAAVGQMSLW